MDSSRILKKPRIIDPRLTLALHTRKVCDFARDHHTPGFIIGLSGIDSILSLIICYNALDHLGKPERILAIHYGDPDGPFVKETFPWLRTTTPGIELAVDNSFDYTNDSLRWAKLHERSIHDPKTGAYLKPTGENYWIVGSCNASEYELGTFSNISEPVAIQPIADLWKSEVLQICRHIGVPPVILHRSYIANCANGNPDLDLLTSQPQDVDAILMVRKGLVAHSYIEEHPRRKHLLELEQLVEKQINATAYKRHDPYRVHDACALMTEKPAVYGPT